MLSPDDPTGPDGHQPPSPPQAGGPHDGLDLEVDLAAFLPEGTSIGAESPEEAEESADADADAPAAEGETHTESVEADAPAETATDPEPAAEPDAPAEAAVDLDGIEADLDAVDAALAALDAGTYGSCAVCQEPIPDDLLDALPTRTTCAVHAS